MDKTKMDALSMAAAARLAGGPRGPDYYDDYGYRKGPKPYQYKPKDSPAGSTHNAARRNAIAARFGQPTVSKKESDPNSITSIKLKHRVHRSIARKLKESGQY